MEFCTADSTHRNRVLLVPLFFRESIFGLLTHLLILSFTIRICIADSYGVISVNFVFTAVFAQTSLSAVVMSMRRENCLVASLCCVTANTIICVIEFRSTVPTQIKHSVLTITQRLRFTVTTVPHSISKDSCSFYSIDKMKTKPEDVFLFLDLIDLYFFRSYSIFFIFNNFPDKIFVFCNNFLKKSVVCLLYTSPSPRD